MLVWSAFILAHLWLGFLNYTAPGLPMGDVTIVYEGWARQSTLAHYTVGIDSVWVYPLAALLPILLAAVFGLANYPATWLSIVLVLDLAAFAVVVGRGTRPGGVRAGWWWTAFLLLLGPIALGRLDSVSVPLAVIAMIVVSHRPQAAAVLLAIATWIKVWPVALIGAVAVTLRRRGIVVATVLAVSGAIVVIGLVLGSGSNVLSFITQQTGRGLQIESPVSTIWLWLADLHVPGVQVYYDTQILTFQIRGPGTEVAAALMNPILGLAALLVLTLGVIAVRHGVPETMILPPLALALVTALFAFNKVGSPQYMTWIAVPVILGLVTHAAGDGRSFRTPAVLALVLAGLTQIIYPYLYNSLLVVAPWMLVVVTLRNALLLALVAWAMRELWVLAREHR